MNQVNSGVRVVEYRALFESRVTIDLDRVVAIEGHRRAFEYSQRATFVMENGTKIETDAFYEQALKDWRGGVDA